MEDHHCYTLSEEDVLQKFDSNSEGLSSGEIPERMERYGKNLLPSKKKLTLFRIILNQFLSPLIYILLAAGIVSIALGEYSDAGFIFMVLLLNAVIGAFQEWKAEEKASALEMMIKLKARVKRDGKTVIVDSEELVPGDIVLLESGNKVPESSRRII